MGLWSERNTLLFGYLCQTENGRCKGNVFASHHCEPGSNHCSNSLLWDVFFGVSGFRFSTKKKKKKQHFDTQIQSQSLAFNHDLLAWVLSDHSLRLSMLNIEITFTLSFITICQNENTDTSGYKRSLTTKYV